jgi:hypothetical protein
MKHILVERTTSIDVGELNREGAFSGRPMHFPFWGLTTRRFKVEYRGPNWPKRRPSQIIPVEWTRCHFGGLRPWFICLCGKRTRKLFPGFSIYCCRECGNLAYESQLRGRKSRLYRKAQEIRRRLGDSGRPGIDAFPDRLPGMWRKTYDRLRLAGIDIEQQLTQGRAFHPRPRKQY